MRMHPLVEEVVAAYLDAVDSEAAGLVEGLYLTGSVALGDFRPQSSDVDFVAVTTTRPGTAALAALERAHVSLLAQRPRSWFDGLYVTWDDLARAPALLNACARSHEGRFQTDGGAGDPVTWYTLARYGIACRGVEPRDFKIWNDPCVLRTWTMDNLDRYWRRLLDRATRFFGLRGLAALSPYMTVWIVLGVSRLHYTLCTGDICSKEHAGHYALRTFPMRWRQILTESLRLRQAGNVRPDFASTVTEFADYLRLRRPENDGLLYGSPVSRRRDVLAYGNMVIADAKLRYRDPLGLGVCT